MGDTAKAAGDAKPARSRSHVPWSGIVAASLVVLLPLGLYVNVIRERALAATTAEYGRAVAHVVHGIDDRYDNYRRMLGRIGDIAQTAANESVETALRRAQLESDRIAYAEARQAAASRKDEIAHFEALLGVASD